MDVNNLTEQQLLELVQNSNARAKQLNNERLVAQGKLATDQQNYERSVEEYQTKYGITLDDTNLNAEKDVVKSNLFEAYQHQHHLIRRIENGEYEVAKPIIHPSNADKVDESGNLKEGYAPVTTARVGVATGVEPNAVQDVQAPVAQQPTPVAQQSAPVVQQPIPQQAPVVPQQPAPVAQQPAPPTQHEGQPQPDLLDLVNQQQAEIIEQVELEEEEEYTQQPVPQQPATIPNTVLPVMPTQPAGGNGLNWAVPQQPTQGVPNLPTMPAAPVGAPPVQVPQQPSNTDGVDVNNMMQGIVSNQTFNG